MSKENLEEVADQPAPHEHEANPEGKALDIAHGLIAKKLAARDTIITPVELVGVLLAADTEVELVAKTDGESEDVVPPVETKTDKEKLKQAHENPVVFDSTFDPVTSLRESGKPEIKNGSETFAKVLEVLASAPAEIGPVDMRDALQAAGVDMPLGNVIGILFPSLMAEGLLTEVQPGTWIVNKETVANKQASAEAHVEEESETQKLFKRRLQVVEEYINYSADANEEITRAKAKEILEAQDDTEEITSASVLALFTRLERDGKIKFIDGDKYERVIAATAETPAELDADSPADEGSIEADAPEASPEEPAEEVVEETAETVEFTPEHVQAAQKWLQEFILKPGNKYVWPELLAQGLRKAGLDGLNEASLVAVLGELGARGLITPFRSLADHWTVNRSAIEALGGTPPEEEDEDTENGEEEDVPAEDNETVDDADEEDPVEPAGGVRGWIRNRNPFRRNRDRTRTRERIPVRSELSAANEAWKQSRRGTAFIERLNELNVSLIDTQDIFDQESEADVERAIIAQEMFDTHYAQVQLIFDQQLEAMTGYSLYDIFNLGEAGEKLFADFGNWVVRQSYLDAATAQGRGRLEKIISLGSSYTQNKEFLQDIMSAERLEELKDKRDTWNAAYKVVGRESRDARDELGSAAPRGWFAEIKGVRKARAYDKWVAEVEADVEQAPAVQARIERQRNAIIAELGAMNGLLSSIDGEETSATSNFAKMLRGMIDNIKTGKPAVEAPAGDLSPAQKEQLERQQAEEAERVLQSVKKMQTQRAEAGVPVLDMYDIQDQDIAQKEIWRLERGVRRFVQKEFVTVLDKKVATGRAKDIVDFRNDTNKFVERLAKSFTGPRARRNATRAVVLALESRTAALEAADTENKKADVVKELKNSITFLKKKL